MVETEGLFLYVKNEFKNISSQKGYPGQHVNDIIMDEDGNTWIASCSNNVNAVVYCINNKGEFDCIYKNKEETG